MKKLYLWIDLTATFNDRFQALLSRSPPLNKEMWIAIKQDKL